MSPEKGDCLFCRIVKGEQKADKVFEDELVMVIKDIKPKAPVHLLILPKAHIGNVAELNYHQENLAGHFLIVAGEIARQEKIDKSGFRLVINNGPGGGQEIPHLHIHFMGGRAMSGTMG